MASQRSRTPRFSAVGEDARGRWPARGPREQPPARRWFRDMPCNAGPSISAVVAAYQAEQWIAETLETILGQTRPPDEVVVVDDGSTDGTVRGSSDSRAGFASSGSPMVAARRPSTRPSGRLGATSWPCAVPTTSGRRESSSGRRRRCWPTPRPTCCSVTRPWSGRLQGEHSSRRRRACSTTTSSQSTVPGRLRMCPVGRDPPFAVRAPGAVRRGLRGR